MTELGIGTMVRFNCPPAESFKRLRDFGMNCCQLCAPPDNYLYGQEGKDNTRRLKEALEEYNIEATSLFISWPDQSWTDHIYSIGLVPEYTRTARLARACRSADWGRELGIVQIASHVGALPCDYELSFWKNFVRDMRPFVKLLGANDQILAYETGMESSFTHKKLMEEIGEENQAINFDPANLLIYNQESPADFIENLGERIIHVHCKDACRPAYGERMGRETRLGDGETNFKELFRTLYAKGYRGPLTIEREIPAGAEQDNDIVYAVKLLKELKKEVKGE
ncbi:MAG: sugar phosphate isomerase/epimerase [Lentisphaeria bacterium]|nr:sugar phosphate isomerase/epimerase [Lentisphaeria bacterium]